jgi:hypothetical protein
MMQQKLDATGRRIRPQLRPTALFWVQFVLRSIGFITSLTAIAIAVFVTVKIHKTWGFVFVSVCEQNCGSLLKRSLFASLNVTTFATGRPRYVPIANILQTLLTLFVDLAEVTALISCRSLKLWFPRVQVFVLIGLDAIAIGLLVWSFFSLIFDKWGRTQAVSTTGYTADPFNGIEMWLAVTIG